ncbi:phosphatase PAP2 family protein [Patescibacteria group bacterium]|nr:phosphatase PAP2 family protein [Patescibacteria group bacterium]
MDTLIIFAATYLVVLVALVGVLAVVWKAEGRRRLLWLLAVSLPLGYALARLAGLFYSHAQPFATEGFEPLVPHAVGNTFPSDHTLAAGIFASVAFLANRRVGLLLWVLTLCIGIARMAAGLHYPLDIAVGALLAVFAVWVAGRGLERMV